MVNVYTNLHKDGCNPTADRGKPQSLRVCIIFHDDGNLYTRPLPDYEPNLALPFGLVGDLFPLSNSIV